MASLARPPKVFTRKRPAAGSGPSSPAKPLAADEKRTIAPAAIAAPSAPMSRVAREDFGAVSSLLDDLEYALEGLASKRATVAVLRRSAAESLAICSDRRQRTTLFRQDGTLVRLLLSLSSVTSADAQLSLMLAAMLNHVARAEQLADVDPRAFAACALLRLRLVTGSADTGAAGALDSSGKPLSPETWAHACEACPQWLDVAKPVPDAPGLRADARTLCVGALLVAADGCGEVREEARRLGGVADVLDALDEALETASERGGGDKEAEMYLELLQAVTFVQGRGGGGEGEGDEGAMPVSSQASGEGTLGEGAGEGARGSASSVASAESSARSVRPAARVTVTAAVRTSSPRLRAVLRVAASASDRLYDARGAHAQGGASSVPPAVKTAVAERPAAAKPAKRAKASAVSSASATEKRDPFAFDEEDDEQDPPAVPSPRVASKAKAKTEQANGRGAAAASVAGPSSSSAAGGAEPPAAGRQAGARDLLLLALEVLVNLTNGSVAGCEQLDAGGISLCAFVITREFEGAASRHGLPAHFDTALMALGVLTNCLEVRPEAKCAVAAATDDGARGGKPGATLLTALADALRGLLEPLPPGGGGEEVEMEREVCAANLTLLLGFLCHGHAQHAAAALRALGHSDWQVLAQLLHSFSELYANAQLLSSESAASMAGIVEWMQQN